MHHQPVITEFPAIQTISIAQKCEKNAISAVLGELFAQLGAYVEANGLKYAGPPLCFYPTFHENFVELEAALQIDKFGPPDAFIKNKSIPAQKVVFVDYYGDLAHLNEGWDALYAYFNERWLKPAGPAFEVYYGPEQTHVGIYSPIF